ncbi:copper chaperone PCu(A)C [Pseudomonadota bacterium]
MKKYSWIVVLTLIFSFTAICSQAKSRWGAEYFPDVNLTTQDGDQVNFFNDLIKDKVVAINFIYTSCPDVCPLETAKLVEVQRLLGDRLGDDIFFYSITIDPEIDSPEVLKAYRDKFGARWNFLTGDESDIQLLRRKLGLYIEEIPDGSNNHNISMIIGNQSTGQWMKRSPFENAHVLADQLSNWLVGWKDKTEGHDYSHAPQLRNLAQGEVLFRTRCKSCHSLEGIEPQDALGPDLLGITQRRELNWLIGWLQAPDKMLEEKDPIAMALYEQYNGVVMPNMGLTKKDIAQLIGYMREESKRIQRMPKEASAELTHGDHAVVDKTQPAGDVVAIMNAWIQEAHPAVKSNAGYMTLVNVGNEALMLTELESKAFGKIEMHEMASVDGLMSMAKVNELIIPEGGMVKLSPGGKHLMLKEQRYDLKPGEIVDMTLTFKSGVKQVVAIKIKANPLVKNNHHH